MSSKISTSPNNRRKGVVYRSLASWLGRWTAADPAGLVDGVNLYVYCGNNPILYTDSTGMFVDKLWDGVKSAGSAIGGAVIGGVVGTVGGAIGGAVAGFAFGAAVGVKTGRLLGGVVGKMFGGILGGMAGAVGGVAGGVFGGLYGTMVGAVDGAGKLIEDFRKFKWSNESEQVALDSTLFSAYKGQFVIRHPFSGSMSLGIMFLEKNLEQETVEDTFRDVNLVKHERGHLNQMRELGFWKYLVGIGIPSATSKLVNNKVYFKQPWEISADIRQGVFYRVYKYATSTSEGRRGSGHLYTWDEIKKGEEYMEWLKENNLKAILKMKGEKWLRTR